MSFPKLSGWRTTAEGLHQSALLLGAIKAAIAQPLPNFLHLSTTIRRDGIATGTLPSGAELRLDFCNTSMLYVPAGEGIPTTVDLEGHTQVSLTAAVLNLLMEQGYTLDVARDALKGTTPFTIDQQISTEYADVLYRIFTALARFRARVFAPMTPIVLWPGHFDLSFLLFTTEKTTEEHPHMNFGFAPYSTGIDRPYLYVYAWPMPEGYTPPELPGLARWENQEFTGVVVPYDDFSQMDDPQEFIEETFHTVYKALLPLLE
jgi:hypothetical protein